VLYRKGRDDLVSAGARVPQAGNDGLKEQALKIDPILLSVYARTFKSITDEMSISMQQTTRSPILCEAKDYVTGLYDAEGRMLEQTENLPILAFSLAPVCKHIKATFGDEIYPATSSSTTTSSASATRTTTSPSSSRLLPASSSPGPPSRATRPTSAATCAGGYNPNAVEVWQEALRIPAVKVVEKGKLRKDVWNLIFANIRLDIVQHDMKAEMGACTIGERRLRRAARQVRPRAASRRTSRRCSTPRAR
jgi:N-methylhydantoinase B